MFDAQWQSGYLDKPYCAIVLPFACLRVSRGAKLVNTAPPHFFESESYPTHFSVAAVPPLSLWGLVLRWLCCVCACGLRGNQSLAQRGSESLGSREWEAAQFANCTRPLVAFANCTRPLLAFANCTRPLLAFANCIGARKLHANCTGPLWAYKITFCSLHSAAARVCKLHSAAARVCKLHAVAVQIALGFH